MKINLGCGKQKKYDFINVDISAKCNPDVVMDITQFPYPWENVQEIELDNLAEHIEPNMFIKVINECHRVLVPGGTMWIRVPLLREDNLVAAFTDPTHINYFTEGTFDYWDVNHARYHTFGKDYGILPWSRREQQINLPFLEICLTK